jgi:acyl carrier protein
MDDLKRLLSSVLRLPADRIADDVAMDNCDAWDSLAHMDLVATLESHYGFQLEADDMVAIRSLAAIRELLQRRGVPV